MIITHTHTHTPTSSAENHNCWKHNLLDTTTAGKKLTTTGKRTTNRKTYNNLENKQRPTSRRNPPFKKKTIDFSLTKGTAYPWQDFARDIHLKKKSKCSTSNNCEKKNRSHQL